MCYRVMETKDIFLSLSGILGSVLGVLNFVSLKRLKRFDANLALERSKAEARYRDQSALIREVDDLVQKLRMTLRSCEQEVKTGQNMSARSKALCETLGQIANEMSALHFRSANFFEEGTIDVISDVSSASGFVEAVFRKFTWGDTWSSRYQAGQDFLTAIPHTDEEVNKWKTEARRFHQQRTTP